MARLDRLSPEQTAHLAEYRDRWLRIGLATGPADRPRAEDAVRRAYAAAGLPAPGIMIWLRSPLEGCIGAAYLTALAEQRRGVWAQVWAQVGDQVRAQVGDQVGAQVRDQVWAQVRDQVRDQVLDQVGDQVWDQVRAQVRDQVRDQVWDQVGAQVRDQVWAQVYRCGYGSHDAGWLAFYRFFDAVCGVAEAQRLRPLGDLAESAGWWWPFAGACILTERPTVLHRDAQTRLHCETGPAVAYPDGWGVFAWHGVRVPAEVIEHPEQITPATIDGERNAEIRRVMLTRYGAGRYIADVGATEIARDVDAMGQPRVLLRREVTGDDPIVMVRVQNSTVEPDGSRREYFLRVHPELRPLPVPANGMTLGEPQDLTPHNAVASTFGRRGEDYRPEVES